MAANSSSERMPRRRRSSSSMSRSRISKAAVPCAVPRGAGGRAGAGSPALVVGSGSAVLRRWRCVRGDAEGWCVVRVGGVVVVLVVLRGVRGAVPVARLHVRRDLLASAAADDLVDLRVEDALDDRRLAHVLQGERVVLALDVDDQRARPEHPLDQRLADVDLGDALQAQLHRVAPDDALAHEDPGRGQRHDVGPPADEAAEQPQAGDEGEDEDRIVRPAGRVLPQDQQHDEGRPHADGREERAEEEDPVRAQLGQELLVLVEEFAREGHGPSVPAVAACSGALETARRRVGPCPTPRWSPTRSRRASPVARTSSSWTCASRTRWRPGPTRSA